MFARIRVLVFLAVASLPATNVNAQSTFGSITGTVTDPSGALVPNAAIEVVNEGTGAVRRVTTGNAGVFNAPNLDLGEYKLRVTAAGFSSYQRTGLRLTANQILNADVQLSIGATTGIVEVHAGTPAIATETTDLSGRLDNESLNSLPLVGRHTGDGGIYAYLTLTTGAAAVPSGALPIVGGSRVATGTLPSMDGIAVMAYAQGASPVQPSMEAIEEVKTETSVAPAEFSTSANIQVISKSGGNQFHGTAFWTYNGNALNSRNFFAAKTPFRVYNNFAAALGGPVIKNKLFFFGDYEGSREAATSTIVESVPLTAWRGGNFGVGGVRQLVDPLNNQPFAGNIIPASRISPVSQRIQDFVYPLSNAGASNSVANNWTANLPGTTGFTVFNHIDARVDYNAGPHDLIFARISWRRMPLTVPGIYPLYRLQTRYGQSGVVAWNHTLSPTAFNEFRFGSTYHRNFYTANVQGDQLLKQFGIQGVPTAGVKTGPGFLINGVTPWSPETNSDTFQDNPEATYQLIDNLSWVRGRHAMKFGFDVVRDQFNGNNIGSISYGQYSFTGVYSGSGYADFLLGIPQQTSLALPSPNRHLRGTLWGLYAQDQFKVNSSLTLNYGLRWEIAEPYSDTKGALYTYSPVNNGLVIPDKGAALISPQFPKNVPIALASAVGYPANLLSLRKNNFEPRVGFAYKVLGNDKTVLRGGYGIYPNLVYATLARSQLSGGPFSSSVTYLNTITNGVPLLSFPNPFLAAGTAATQNVNAVRPDLSVPYTQQWNLTLERQLGSYGLRVSYVGSRSINLIYRRNLNLPDPSLIPFTVARRPNQLYNQIIYADNGGTDSYNALELAASKRYGKNLTFSSGFTWAKALTDTQDNSGGGTTFGGQVIQNPLNRNIEKANNKVVVPRRFFAYADYALPLGVGQPLLGHAPGVVQALLGGWRTTWTVVTQSGQYFTPSFAGFDPSNTGTQGGVPDRIGNGNLSSGLSATHAFDASAFAIPGCPAETPVCAKPANVGRYGNSGFNIIAGPPLRNLDFGLLKDFHIWERVNLRFSLTMANALNHPNFSEPASNISSTGTVGVVSSQARVLYAEPGPREIDFGLRLRF